ncbi:YdhK family protein [Saccharibacillus sp. CPCC 101409]|uniref:YdhK family protein n=1 Tax=Saccharibacillus sp. CPCC 101409 TaxID=3058041 RepID=UPI0026725883|nr:YdhK family protein [Saccharibacillus sp. CPCC 101409]MDO3409545.1 YdhK family protein [Saccharibacillus sp. CPCC 101409]
MQKKMMLLFVSAAASLALLAGCSSGSNESRQAGSGSETGSSQGDMAGMNHGSSGEMPEGLQDAANPKYPVGTEVTIRGEHMEGMDGATGTVTGAYDTTIYSLSYTPTTGGDPVTDHEWIIHEELKNAGSEPLKPGDKAIIEADHMEGMRGAEATIDTAEQGVIYMLDYTPTTGGETVKNHMWVTEDELSAK